MAIVDRLVPDSPVQTLGSIEKPFADVFAGGTSMVELLQKVSGTAISFLQNQLLTRSIGGTTSVVKASIPDIQHFQLFKTLVSDADGTVGVYTGDVDAATILVTTFAISAVRTTNPALLGNVATNADLPQTVEAAVALGWPTPNIDDYANVLADETFDGKRVEWYVTAIDGLGNITWGNPIPLNDGDYQSQSTAADAGKVLIGGSDPGKFGGGR